MKSFLAALVVVTIIGAIVFESEKTRATEQMKTEAVVVRAMREISIAQTVYAEKCGGGFYARDLATLGAMPGVPLRAELSEKSNVVYPAGEDYTIVFSPRAFAEASASCDGRPAGKMPTGYIITATPVVGDGMSWWTYWMSSSSGGAIYKARFTAVEIARIMKQETVPTGAVLVR